PAFIILLSSGARSGVSIDAHDLNRRQGVCTMSKLDQAAERIAQLLIARGESVAVAESAAGGLISEALLGVAGASAYFKGGVVVYTGDGKEQLAGMTPEQLSQHRSATEPHAAQLAA